MRRVGVADGLLGQLKGQQAAALPRRRGLAGGGPAAELLRQLGLPGLAGRGRCTGLVVLKY